MGSLWHRPADFYYDLMSNRSDPRVKDWPMMSGPLPTTLICIFYVYFVKVLGPKLMKNRQPFVLRRVMIFYNLFQVIISTWLFYKALEYGWWNDYSFKCQPVDYSDSPKAIGIATVCWSYHMVKFVEFFDTIFFVLRKKNEHISTLHVYHHAIMPFGTWFGVKFSPGGHLSFFGVINSFVHIIMYGYYLLAAFGPQMKPYLWWKKYLTTLQMIQFMCVIVHSCQLFFYDCGISTVFTWWVILQAIMFLFLFNDFYIHSYVYKKTKITSNTPSPNKKK